MPHSVDLSQFKIWTEEEFERVFMPSPASRPNGSQGTQGADADAGADTIDEASLPDDLLDLIRDGVSGTKDRSRAFMHAVGRLKDHGATVDGVYDLMSRYPDGIADKYLRPKNRLRREIERAYAKIPDPPPVSPAPTRSSPSPTSLDQVLAVFGKWLALDDPTPIHAVLGAVAANMLPGDAVWLGVIAPPSSAKTEILNALARVPHIEMAATLTPAALLSSTPKRQVGPGAKGGLLNKIGAFGVLVLRDFGSILSMHGETRTELLAALREIYDGAWTRHLGVDGGKELSWRGKLGLVFAATESLDDYHAVIASLGHRFLICRMASDGDNQLDKAFDHTGAAAQMMRDELAAAVGGLFGDLRQDPPPLSGEERLRLRRVVRLAVRLRAHVERDRHTREILSIHGAEGPARMALGLERLLAGLHAIGIEREPAFAIIHHVALASTPAIRKCAYDQLTETSQATRSIAEALRLPTTTARRALEELEAQGLAKRIRGSDKRGNVDAWTIDPIWAAEKDR